MATTCKLHFDPNPGPDYGLTLVVGATIDPRNKPSEFPRVNIGPNPERWVPAISALFSQWAMTFRADILVKVEDDGQLSAWMVKRD